MSEMLVVHSAAQLVRSYPDVPFDTTKAPEAADSIVSRTASALAEAGYTPQLLRETRLRSRAAMAEAGLIPAALLREPGQAAVFMPREGGAAVLAGGAEHVTILSRRPGLALAAVAEDCFRVDDCLSRSVRFAFDEELGYLCSRPDMLGTGLRVTVRLHLPLMRLRGGMEEISAAVREMGVGAEAVAVCSGDTGSDLVDVFNLTALGCTEEMLIRQVEQAALTLCARENALRSTLLKGKNNEPDALRLQDRISRALPVMRAARLMEESEFTALWSALRLGAETKRHGVPLETVDALLQQGLTGHLWSYAEEESTGEMLNACRADRVRELLSAAPRTKRA